MGKAGKVRDKGCKLGEKGGPFFRAEKANGGESHRRKPGCRKEVVPAAAKDHRRASNGMSWTQTGQLCQKLKIKGKKGRGKKTHRGKGKNFQMTVGPGAGGLKVGSGTTGGKMGRQDKPAKAVQVKKGKNPGTTG